METVRPYPEDLVQNYRRIWLGITMIDAFDRTCSIIPEKEAVKEGGTRLTYA
jgi:non-ribosomal peptide synthetase component E (peptide arylation enzyme)